MAEKETYCQTHISSLSGKQSPPTHPSWGLRPLLHPHSEQQCQPHPAEEHDPAPAPLTSRRGAAGRGNSVTAQSCTRRENRDGRPPARQHHNLQLPQQPGSTWPGQEIASVGGAARRLKARCRSRRGCALGFCVSVGSHCGSRM